MAAPMDTSTYEGEVSTMTDTDTDCDEEAGRAVLAFDPSQLTNGGDNGLPQNGHDYIKLVQEERKKYPQVVSCTAPPPSKSSSLSSESTESTSMRAEETRNLDNTPYKLKYHQEILDNFRSLKEEIEAIRQQDCDQGKKPNINVVKNKNNNNHDNNNKSVIEERVKCGENNINRLLRRMELGYSPLLSDIIDKDQYEIHQTLEKLADECELMQSSYPQVIHADWIYSLMAALRDPIEADIYSTLRRFAKICIKNEKSYGTHAGEGGGKIDRDTLNSCLLIICIVRHHFGQMDLK